MDVVDVYKFLALRGDFNITISKNIAGRVTLYLKNVSIRDALDIVSLANSLAYRVVGKNIIYAMTEAEYQSIYGEKFNDKRVLHITRLEYTKPSYILEALRNIKSDIGKIVIDEDTGTVVMMDTQEKIDEMLDMVKKIDTSLELVIYDLKYANAEDVVAKLKEKIDNKAVGSTQADTRSNQVIVRAFPERLKEVEQMIKALDTKTKAVLIDVRILKITYNPKFDFGIDWDSYIRNGHRMFLEGTFPISSTISQVGTLGQVTIGRAHQQDDFAVNLKILKQVDSTKILASPSLLVTNNQEAKIHIGDKLAYVTTTTIGTGDSQRVNEEIHYIDVGVKFIVTPTINEDGFITMKIAPEISSKSGELTTPNQAKIPLINATSVETKVIVKDGHTIIIAGLKQDDISDVRKGIPILMDIPLIGGMFSNTTKSNKKTEIVILLTPNIVSGTESYPDQKLERENTPMPYKTY
jgi:type II secretory pathway component GspD/PulD (secretin)